MNTTVHNTKPWYREPWPWILMTGPIIVIVAGFVTAWLAIRSYDGLVDDDYYKQGLAVNQRVERDQKAADLGLAAEIMLGGEGRGVRLLLSGKTLDVLPAALILKITHPTRAGHDQVVTLKRDGDGLYSGQLTAQLQGRWNVMLESEDRAWRIVGEWNPDKQQALRLPAAASVSSNHHGG